jgi:hypothetical protein
LAAPTAQQPLERQKSAIARNDRAPVFLLAVLVEATVCGSAPSYSPQAAKGSVLIRTGARHLPQAPAPAHHHRRILRQICCAAFRFVCSLPQLLPGIFCNIFVFLLQCVIHLKKLHRRSYAPFVGHKLEMKKLREYPARRKL